MLAEATPSSLVSSPLIRVQGSLQPLSDVTGDRARAAGSVVIAAHSGVTVDILRTVAGDGVVDERLLREGKPNRCLTTLLASGDQVDVVGIGVDPQVWSVPRR